VKNRAAEWTKERNKKEKRWDVSKKCDVEIK